MLTYLPIHYRGLQTAEYREHTQADSNGDQRATYKAPHSHYNNNSCHAFQHTSTYLKMTGGPIDNLWGARRQNEAMHIQNVSQEVP